MSDTKPVEKRSVDLTELAQDLFNIMCAVRGTDPKQVQGIARLMDVENVDETTFYPNQKTSIAIAQLRMFGQGFYRGESWNEYDMVADLLGTGFKGLKGFKSNQYVETVSGQQNLEKLQGLPEETRKGILSGLFNRGRKTE